MQKSIVSYPDRGQWGNSSYRGNCTGHLYRDVFRALQPEHVVDPTCGSGTSLDVAREMGIEAVGLDLRDGFNGLRDSILAVVGRWTDLCLSHLPYHDMISYSGAQWGDSHPDDLSRCASVDEFLDKAHQFLLNQRDATKPGQYYATLIGDLRRRGRYYSFQAEFISRMPGSELKSVVIKAQHNCTSDRAFSGPVGQLPRIAHEYLLIWQRAGRLSVSLDVLREMAGQAHRRLRSTWRAVVRQAMVSLGGEATLSSLYERIAGNQPEQMNTNQNWQAKVRQVVQQSPDFERVDRGRWRLADA
jgi:hypothetical protein